MMSRLHIGIRSGGLGLFALLLALAPTLPALAQPDAPPAEVDDDGTPAGEEPADDVEALNARVEELSLEGATLFKEGRHAEAIARFEEAYALVPVANLLYNIALVHERAGDVKQAIAYYERFIVAQDADPDVRARALARIKEIEEEQAARERARREAQKPPPPQPKPQPPQDEAATLGDLAVTGIIVGGVGVAMVGTGAIFGVMASNDEDAFRDTRVPSEKDALQDSAESRALTADILYGVGGAAIIAGVSMILIEVSGDREPPSEASDWRWGPGPGQVGVGVAIPWGGP